MTSYFQTSSTENVPGSLDVSETDHSLGDESQKTEESEETAIISEDLNVSETVADYPTPNNKNSSERENADEKETEPAHAENNRRNDLGMWLFFSTDDIAYQVGHGRNYCQHHTGPFQRSCWTFNKDKQTRYCSQKIFFGVKTNDEKYT